jgi:hypothetical protein
MMKTTKILSLGLFLAILVAFGTTSCKKDKTTNPGDSNTTSLQNLANDENQVSAATDEANSDINAVIGGTGGLKSTAGWHLPCNATIDSSTVLQDTITYYITYNGTNCRGNLDRHGKVEIKKNVNTRWHQAGAVVYYKFIDLRVTHVHSNKSVTLNGQKKYTNVSGGLVWMIPQYISSVTFKDEGYMNVTLADSTTKSWNLARQTTFTFSTTDNDYVLTVDGFGSAGGYNNLVLWGTNRNGEQFYTQILQSVVHRAHCGWDPCSGQKKHMIPGDSKGATLTFGYDSNDQPTTDCPTKYKVDWYKGNKSGTLYLFLP